MAESRLALLPEEILLSILAPLSSSDLVNLSICSRRLQHRIEPSLYHRIVEPSAHWHSWRAITWAVLHNHDSVIFKAAHYGVVRKWQNPAIDLSHLVREDRFAAFELLWNLGFWSPADEIEKHNGSKSKYGNRRWSVPRGLLQPAAVPSRLRFLHHMIEHPLRTQHCMGEAIVDILLREVLRRSDTSIGTVQTLLSRGADPARVQATGGLEPCPVALAVKNTKIETMDLLLARGASIHGRRFWRRCDRILHFPIFTAAARMAEHGPTAVVECLKRGASVNARGMIFASGGSQNKAFMPMPIYVYLEYVKDWNPHPPAPKIGPVDGIKFWLERGVVLGRDGIPVHDFLMPPTLRVRGITVLPIISFLVHRWGARKLKDDDFFVVIKWLAGLDCPETHTSWTRTELVAEVMRQEPLVQERWLKVSEILKRTNRSTV